MIEKVVKIVVDNKDAVKSIDQVNESLDNTNEQLDDINQTAGQGFDNAAKGANNFGRAIKGVGTALKAAGIGLVIAAVAKLGDMFVSSSRGAYLLDTALQTINTVFLEIINRGQILAQSLGFLLDGEFERAGQTASRAFEGFGEALANAAEQGGKVADLNRAVKALDDSLILVESRQMRIMEQNRVIADDDNRTTEDRIAAANRLEEASQTLFSARVTRYEKEIEALDAIGTLNEEQTTRRFELLAEIETAEEDHNARLSELLGIRRGIVSGVEEGQTEPQEVIDAKSKGVQLLEVETDIADQKIDINKRTNEEIANQDEALYQTRKEAALASAAFQLGLASDLFLQLAGIAEEGSQQAKTLAIAGTLMKAAEASIGIWTSSTSLPEPFATANRIANQAALAVSTGIALSQIGKASEGSASASRSAPQIPAPSFNIVGPAGESALQADLIASGVTDSIRQEPIKAYVVSTEVSTQQALDRRIATQASF